MSINKKYTRELRRELGYFATWFPNVNVELGDIGILRGSTFTKISDLESLGFSFEVEQNNPIRELSHQSKGGVSVLKKLSGKPAPAGSQLVNTDAGIIINFNREGAIFFEASGVTAKNIKDQIKLSKEIKERFVKGTWLKQWVVITEVIQADNTSIVISETSDSKLELKASAQVTTGDIKIAEIDFSAGVMFNKGVNTKFGNIGQSTPLFNAVKLKGMLTSTVGPAKTRLVDLGTNNIIADDLITPKLLSSDDNLLYLGEAEYEDTSEMSLAN